MTGHNFNTTQTDSPDAELVEVTLEEIEEVFRQEEAQEKAANGV